jgi:hypothetical protein
LYKERLRLTPEQEKNWPAYESALEALVKQRRDRMEKRHEEVRPSDPTQRMRQRAEALSGMGAALSRLADAQQPLYNNLDAGQRRRFATLSQILGDHSDMRRRLPDRDYDRRAGVAGTMTTAAAGVGGTVMTTAAAGVAGTVMTIGSARLAWAGR